MSRILSRMWLWITSKPVCLQSSAHTPQAAADETQMPPITLCPNQHGLAAACEAFPDISVGPWSSWEDNEELLGHA